MDEGTSKSGPGVGKPGGDQSSEPEELRRDIAETREELGDTVEAMAHKTDVKGRAKAKLTQTREDAKAKVGETRARVSSATPEEARRRPVLLVSLAVLGGLLLWRFARR
jgi:MYXO-CTERM domain-containing protein